MNQLLSLMLWHLFKNDKGLTKFLQLKICAKVTLFINMNIQDSLINGQVTDVFHISSAQNNVQKVYVKFLDSQTGLRVMKTASHLSRQGSCVGIEKSGTEACIISGSIYPSIKKTRLTLALACLSTVHKAQGLTLNQGVVDFDLKKQKSFEPRLTYTTLSK